MPGTNKLAPNCAKSSINPPDAGSKNSCLLLSGILFCTSCLIRDVVSGATYCPTNSATSPALSKAEPNSLVATVPGKSLALPEAMSSSYSFEASLN